MLPSWRRASSIRIPNKESDPTEMYLFMLFYWLDDEKGLFESHLPADTRQAIKLPFNQICLLLIHC